MSLDRTLTGTPVQEKPNEHKSPPRTTPSPAAEVDLEKAHTSRPELPPHINAPHLSGHLEIPDKQQIEILGRIRPSCFKSNWSEYGFVLSLCMAQVIVVSASNLIKMQTLIVPGILCLRLQRAGSIRSLSARHSALCTNLASLRLLPRNLLLPPPYGPVL